MKYSDLINEDKLKKEKDALKKQILEAKDKLKEVNGKIKEEKRQKKLENEEDIRTFIFKANNILHSGLFDEVWKDDNYANLLDNGELVGIYFGEIFYTRKEGKKNYLYMEKVKPISIPINKDSSFCKDAYSFVTSRVQFDYSGFKKPQVDYRHYESLQVDSDFYLYTTYDYEVLQREVLAKLPKENIEKLFNKVKESEKSTKR